MNTVEALWRETAVTRLAAARHRIARRAKRGRHWEADLEIARPVEFVYVRSFQPESPETVWSRWANLMPPKELRPPTSRFFGVHRDGDRWLALHMRPRWEGLDEPGGGGPRYKVFDIEIEAARKYDRWATEVGDPVNFPPDTDGQVPLWR